MALDELMLHLHVGGISCRGRIPTTAIGTRCHRQPAASPSEPGAPRAGGLYSDEFEPAQGMRLVELQNALGLTLFLGPMDFQVSRQHRQSVLSLFAVCWRRANTGSVASTGPTRRPC